MAVTLDAYFPFAAGAGQVTTVAQWEILAPRVGLRNGVVIGDLNEMAVFADATDLVVARLDLTNSRIELDVVAVWEIALGRVTVPGADTTIDAGQVLDVRSFARPQGAEIGDGKLVFYNAPANSAEVFFQGQTVSRFTYAALFALFGTTFGPGDGSTTFVLPNLQGGALTVRDPGQTEFDTVGERGGAKSATLTAGQIPPLPFTTGGESNDHVHETLIRKFALDLVTGGGGSQTLSFFSDPNDNVGRGSLVTPDTSGASTAHSHSGVTSSGGSPLSLLSPYAVVNVAVRAR
jgi:microcystin-dependent protein